MKPEIADQLLRLNLQFYQTFASHFSSTRQRIQPGVRRILPQIAPNHQVLDVGCGNGNLWQALARSAYRGAYTGIDFCPEFIDIAVADAERLLSYDETIPRPVFLVADLREEGWADKAPENNYDWVFLLAVLHHLPGVEMRQKVMKAIRGLMSPAGRLVISIWQFRNSEKLSRRIQDWSTIKLAQSDVDPGDYLLDWRSGGTGLRYVHEFNTDELQSLAVTSGFSIRSAFNSDGSGGQLGHYQVWEYAK